jgi:glycosyltransferase involved in cell wall biosynthesis
MQLYRHKVQLSIVVPMYNESSNISELYSRITTVLNSTRYSYEIICVNDGSKDDTIFQLYQLHKQDPKIKVLDLSRHFGKEAAMTAGLDYSSGEAVVIIDSDLQDPPELIPQLINKMKEGYDVVYATRTKRDGDTSLKKLTAFLFYRLMEKLSPVNIPKNSGDYRIMTRQVVDALKSMREHHRFMKGIFSWAGFNQTGIPYLRESRHSGKSKFNYWQLWNFALEGITSFSFLPLQLATYMGIFIAFCSMLYAFYMFIKTLLFGNPVPGYPSLMVTMLFLGGIQLISLGVIGEYIGRIYNESKKRPLYFIKHCAGLKENSFDNSVKIKQ